MDVFEPLADPKRRRVVQLLGTRPHRAGELAEATGMTAHDRGLGIGVVVLETRDGAEQLAMGFVPGAEIRPGVRVTRTEVLEVAATA
jgi:hypothetical protein